MINQRSIIFRGTSVLLCMSLTAMSAVLYAYPPRKGPHVALPKPKPEAKPSRLLTAKEMRAFSGRDAANPYVTGLSRQSVVSNGVDLMTGNYTYSATDLSFEGGYGVPIAVSRTYNSNNGKSGPFGRGWTFSVDIRTTAGGLLKSSGSADLSVPVFMTECPAGQFVKGDAPSEEGAVAIDASGKENKINREADGVMMGPLADKNLYENAYEEVTTGEGTFQVLVSQKVTTPEDTVYIYEKKGYYIDGISAYDEGVSTSGTTGTTGSTSVTTGSTGVTGSTGGLQASWGEYDTVTTPSNILKITSITDRQGNETTFTYSSTSKTFANVDGDTSEQLLETVSMPGGRELEFTWMTGTGVAPRILSVTDGDRVVDYTYSDGLLVAVDSPADRTTEYSYATPLPWVDVANEVEVDAGPTLHTITDPRGLVTTLKHGVSKVSPIFYDGVDMFAIVCYEVISPNGVRQFMTTGGGFDDPDDEFQATGLDQITGDRRSTFAFYGADFSTSGGNTPLNAGWIFSEVTDHNSTNDWDDTYDVTINDYKAQSLDDITQLNVPQPVNYKEYLLVTGDIKRQVDYSYQVAYGNNLPASRDMLNNDYYAQKVETTSSFNFQGNPLQVTVAESEKADSGAVASHPFTSGVSRTTYFAYHDADKYYQQKAVKDPGGRITYKDYYDRNADAGRRGQVYRVYDSKWTNGWSNNWTPSTIAPTTSANYSAQFDYDSVGRPDEVWKLQKATGLGSGYEYTKTETTYGSSGSPYWGLAWKVKEDAGGSGHANRETETIEYDIAGRAIETKDATGKYWFTTYDDDGLVQSVNYKPTSTSSSVPVFTYQYGTGVSEAMPITVTDELSGVEQTISYYSLSSAPEYRGQVDTVGETNGSTNYSVQYTYTPAGERASALYDTPNGQSKYRYTDYTPIGSPTGPSRAFQTLVKQQYVSSAWSDTNEKFFYRYTTAGRLEESTFAHDFGHTGGEEGWDTVLSRGRTWQRFDSGGRLINHYNVWDEIDEAHSNSGSTDYDWTAIGKACFEYGYNTSKNLRTSMAVKDWSSSTWVTDHTENYTYDSNLDYLTDVDYNDGLANEAVTWDYDPAGNRKSDSRYSSGGTWTYDWLNRMTASPSLDGTGPSTWNYTNDVLGNRTNRNLTTSNTGAAMNTWDALNRMTAQMRPSTGATYSYRADGMRVEKKEGAYASWSSDRTGGWYAPSYATTRPVTRYFYDGQMPMEEDYNPSGSVTKVTRNTLGGRGIEMISTTASSTTTVAYPLYDGHGNMVATLAKNGSGGYTPGNWRTYDVWGSVRSGSATGDPTKRYCANLGHQADDESDLIYMRARYYEPASGRFVSEDPAMDGRNWFSYVSSNPVNLIDQAGREGMPAYWGAMHAAALGAGVWIGYHIGAAFYIFVLKHNSNEYYRKEADWLSDIHDNFFVGVLHGGFAGVCHFVLEHTELIKFAPVASLASVSLSFGYGLLLGFISGFTCMLVLGLLHDIDNGINGRPWSGSNYE